MYVMHTRFEGSTDMIYLNYELLLFLYLFNVLFVEWSTKDEEIELWHHNPKY